MGHHVGGVGDDGYRSSRVDNRFGIGLWHLRMGSESGDYMVHQCDGSILVFELIEISLPGYSGKPKTATSLARSPGLHVPVAVAWAAACVFAGYLAEST